MRYSHRRPGLARRTVPIAAVVAVAALIAGCSAGGGAPVVGPTSPTPTLGAPETPHPTLSAAPVGDVDADGVWYLDEFSIGSVGEGPGYRMAAIVVGGSMRVSIEEETEATLAMDGAFRVEVSEDMPFVEVQGSGDEQASLVFDRTAGVLHWTQLPGGSGLTFSVEGQTVDAAMFGAGGGGGGGKPFQPAAEMAYEIDADLMTWTYSTGEAEARWVWHRAP